MTPAPARRPGVVFIEEDGDGPGERASCDLAAKSQNDLHCADGATGMGRWSGGGRATCESCKSIDVRHLQREGRLWAGQRFSWSWTRGSEPSGSIGVRTETDAVVLIFRSRSHGAAEWKSIEQREHLRSFPAKTTANALEDICAPPTARPSGRGIFKCDDHAVPRPA
jgi:hypothetical protein